MAITAALVKELRERTGSGMMECKRTLVETHGDVEAAIELMRTKGLAKADKKAGRIAAEGEIMQAQSPDGKQAVMVEINSETDFVVKSEDFQGFVGAVTQCALESQAATAEVLLETTFDTASDETVNMRRQALIAKIGENISVRRLVRVETEGVVGSYLHGNRIGVLVALEGGDTELAKDIAMHVAASKPICVSADEVPAEVIEKERTIFIAQAEESGKPPEIAEKMVGGRIKKYLKEVTLLGQPFVKNPDVTIEQLLKGKGAKVVSFARLEVGEGIEKKEENFAEEVMAQAKGV